jgi:hypothetical protein
MRITRIDIEGVRHPRNAADGEHYATITRKRGSEFIEVTILTPAIPNGRTHHVQADCRDDLWSMAECLQETLDGVRGTNSMIHDYFRQLELLAD